MTPANTDAAIALLQALQQDPRDVNALRALAALRLRQQNLPEAEALAQGAVAAAPLDPLVHVALANVRMAQKRLDEAQALLDHALALAPLAEVHATRAVLEMRRNNLAGAIEHARAAVAAKPGLATAWQLLAHLYQQAGQLAPALQALEKVVEHDAGNVTALVELGEWYRRGRRLDDALGLLQRAVELAPGLAPAWVNFGTALQDARRLQEAAVAYEKATTINPQQLEVHCNLGLLYRDCDRLSDAVRSYQRALAIDPNCTEALSGLGVVFKQLGRLDEAVASCQRAIAVNPDFAAAHDNLGIILKDMGRLTESLQAFRQALAALTRRTHIPPPEPKPYMDPEVANQALLALKAALDAEGVPFFLAYGTLLGIVRDGRLLPHDKDMDVGVAWDVPRDELVDKLIQRHGFAATDPFLQTPEKREWNVSLVHRATDIAIDLFFFKPEGEHLLSGVHQLPVPLLWRFSRFTTRGHEFLGQQWQVPDTPERYLEEIYGSGWRTPDAYFDSLISGHNRNPEALDVALCYAYNRLFDRVHRGEWLKAAGYCRQIQQQRPDPFIAELNQWLQARIDKEAT